MAIDGEDCHDTVRAESRDKEDMKRTLYPIPGT